jgi:hypothetical protein
MNLLRPPIVSVGLILTGKTLEVVSIDKTEQLQRAIGLDVVMSHMAVRGKKARIVKE